MINDDAWTHQYVVIVVGSWHGEAGRFYSEHEARDFIRNQ